MGLKLYDKNGGYVSILMPNEKFAEFVPQILVAARYSALDPAVHGLVGGKLEVSTILPATDLKFKLPQETDETRHTHAVLEAIIPPLTIRISAPSDKWEVELDKIPFWREFSAPASILELYPDYVYAIGMITIELNNLEMRLGELLAAHLRIPEKHMFLGNA
jgi:hypothetical protein